MVALVMDRNPVCAPASLFGKLGIDEGLGQRPERDTVWPERFRIETAHRGGKA